MVQDWGVYITESRKVITESEKKAKDVAMKVLSAHFDDLYDDMEPSEEKTFRAFLTKMKKL